MYFRKYSNIKLHENPSSYSRGVPRGQTDITNLIVTYRDFAVIPKKKEKIKYENSD
jgi:hypothetical protein